MFLYLRTGGGHINSAKAISSYIDEHYSAEAETILVDDIEEQSDFANFMSKQWAFAQYKAKWWGETYYALGKAELYDVPIRRLERSIIDYLEERILETKPDKIIIFHSFLISSVFKIIKRNSLDIKTRVIVTDPFTIPKSWLSQKESKYVLFSEQARRYAYKRKIKYENTIVFPYIVNDKYSKKPTARQEESYKKKFGVNNGKKTILFNAAGYSTEKAKSIMKSLLKNKIDVNFMIMCGKSKEMRRKIELIAMEYPRKVINLYEYNDYVEKLIGASDFVICKAGPATVFEILLQGKIPIITSYMWEQEKGNVQFVVNNKIGFYEPRVRMVAWLFKEILDESGSGIVDQINWNREELELRNGTPEVSEYILNM